MRKLEYVETFSIPSLSEKEGYIDGTEEDIVALLEEQGVDMEEYENTYVIYPFTCTLLKPVEEEPVAEEGGNE